MPNHHGGTNVRIAALENWLKITTTKGLINIPLTAGVGCDLKSPKPHNTSE